MSELIFSNFFFNVFINFTRFLFIGDLLFLFDTVDIVYDNR